MNLSEAFSRYNAAVLTSTSVIGRDCEDDQGRNEGRFK